MFAISFQIWNPGGLPFDLTIQDLLDPAHSSKPRNKLIAQIFYDMGIIERYGSGIQRMIIACRKIGVPDPVLEEKSGGFSITFQKDICTEDRMRKLGLNERQVKAVLYVKEKGKITNSEYQTLNYVSKAMASLELRYLVDRRHILEKVGTTGRGTAYVLANKGLKGLIKG